MPGEWLGGAPLLLWRVPRAVSNTANAKWCGVVDVGRAVAVLASAASAATVPCTPSARRTW